MENDLQFYFRRAKAMELKFGPSPVQLKRLGEQLEAGASARSGSEDGF
jgi:hypothetical protein